MTTRLELTLPFPPSVNHYWRHIASRGFVRAIISRPGRQYQALVAQVVAPQLPREWKPLTGSLSIRVILTRPDNRRRDLDNSVKALLDALTKARVWVDDAQIHHMSLEWADGVKRGGQVDVSIVWPPFMRKLEEA